MTRTLARFFLLGALLFAADRLFPRVEAVGASHASDDDVLFRRALALGLDRRDSVVQRRLLANMAFLESEAATADECGAAAADFGMTDSDPVVRRRLVERLRARLSAGVTEPSEAELRDYLDTHAAEFASPPLWRLSQRFLGPQPLPLPESLPPKSQAALAKLFGADFAAAVVALPPGEWRGPLRSAYGEHRVRVEEITPAHAADLDAVRERVRGAILAERRAARIALALRRWRGEGG